MPRVKRRELIARRTLDDYELYLFSYGPPFDPRSELAEVDDLEGLYWEHRTALLTRNVNPPVALRCWPYWRYEPSIPDELRELPPQDDPRQGLADPSWYRRPPSDHQRIQGLRRAWLAAHPPEMEPV
jgi:hypothetical protein